MSIHSSVSSAQVLACHAQLEALQSQLGAVLTSRILEAEAADFHWAARVREHYLGLDCGGVFGAGEELSRIAIVSELGGAWHAGVCLVDGDGEVAALLWLRTLDTLEEAETVFGTAH